MNRFHRRRDIIKENEGTWDKKEKRLKGSNVMRVPRIHTWVKNNLVEKKN